MRPIIRYLLTVLAGLFFLFSGISLFHLRNYEIVYDATPPLITCHQQGCTMIYTLNIGNTGLKAPQNLLVSLSNSALEHSLMPPKVRNFGKVPRPSEITKQGTSTLIELGTLEPGKRVEVSLLLQYDDRSEAPSWEQILLGISADQAEVRKGNPDVISFGRFLYGLVASLF